MNIEENGRDQNEQKAEKIINDIKNDYDTMYIVESKKKTDQDPRSRIKKTAPNIKEKYQQMLFESNMIKERVSLQYLAGYLMNVEEEFNNYLKRLNSRWITTSQREIFKNDLKKNCNDFSSLKQNLVICMKQFPMTDQLEQQTEDEIFDTIRSL